MADPTPIPRPRNHDLYAQYIRRRYNRYQARPYLRGVGRQYLGSFDTYHDARRAVVKFFAGQLRPLPRFVKPVFADGRPCKFAADAEGFVGEIRTPLIHFRSPIFPTRELAHAAAVEHLNAMLSHIRDLADPTHGDRRKPKRGAAPTLAHLVAVAPATIPVAVPPAIPPTG